MVESLILKLVHAVLLFVGLFLKFAAGILEYMLGLNLLVMNYQDNINTIIRDGWVITRDIANLGFVLALILIAFATILRFREYGAKRLLVRFIAAALIVNFSFVIAGVFINFSHVITIYFLNLITPSAALGEQALPIGSMSLGYRIGDVIMSLINPQRLIMTPSYQEGSPEIEGADADTLVSASSFITELVQMAFAIVFMLLALIFLLVFAIMLFVRYLMLTILVILAPIAWLFWVIPTLQGQFQKWWDKFISWTFFPPAMAFFLYLSLRSLSSISFLDATVAGSKTSAIMLTGMEMIVAIGLLSAGLWASKIASAQVAGAAIRLAQAATVGAVAVAGRGAWRAARGVAQPVAQGTQRAAQRVGGAILPGRKVPTPGRAPTPGGGPAGGPAPGGGVPAGAPGGDLTPESGPTLEGYERFGPEFEGVSETEKKKGKFKTWLEKEGRGEQSEKRWGERKEELRKYARGRQREFGEMHERAKRKSILYSTFTGVTSGAFRAVKDTAKDTGRYGKKVGYQAAEEIKDLSGGALPKIPKGGGEANKAILKLKKDNESWKRFNVGYNSLNDEQKKAIDKSVK